MMIILLFRQITSVINWSYVDSIKEEYLAIMHIGDTKENPSQIIRKTTCDDPVIFKTEGCNRAMKWRESNHYIKYFIGMADEGYSMTKNEAEKILIKWRENWKNPTFDEKMR